MTVEDKAPEAQVVEVAVSELEPEKVSMAAEKVEEEEAKPKTVEKSSSFKEESNFLSDLKEHEKKALNELKSKLEDAILGSNLFKKENPKEAEQKKELKAEEEGEQEEKKKTEEGIEEKSVECVKSEEKEEDKKGDAVVGGEEISVEEVMEVDKDISLWGIPLLPSKGVEGTNVLLLKFLRAREFKVTDAFEMLKKTLQWRKDFKADLLLGEDLGTDLSPVAYMSGVDREGHPICYNIFGALANEELYQKAFGTEEKRELFLRWRFQLMEKGI